MATGRHAKPTRRPLARAGRHRRPARVGARALSVAVVPVVLSGGVAYAFWSATGTGSATVSTTSATPLTVTASATPPPDLYPGRTVDLGISVANGNGYPVSLTRLTAVTVASSDASACPASNITLPTAVVDGMAAGGYTLPTPINVAAGASSTATLTGLLTLAPGAPNGCQGKTFTVTVTLTGSQV